MKNIIALLLVLGGFFALPYAEAQSPDPPDPYEIHAVDQVIIQSLFLTDDFLTITEAYEAPCPNTLVVQSNPNNFGSTEIVVIDPGDQYYLHRNYSYLDYQTSLFTENTIISKQTKHPEINDYFNSIVNHPIRAVMNESYAELYNARSKL